MKKLFFCCSMLLMSITAFMRNNGVADCYGRKYSAVDSTSHTEYTFFGYTCMRNDTLLEIKLVPTGKTGAAWQELSQDPVWIRQVWKPLADSIAIHIVETKK